MLMTIGAKGVERKIQIVARHLVFGDPPDHGTGEPAIVTPLILSS